MRRNVSIYIILSLILFSACKEKKEVRQIKNFNSNWSFLLGDSTLESQLTVDGSEWRNLNLPHDWSIEGEFSEDHPATVGGGALPGGIGWYKKHFKVEESLKNKNIFIEFDGVYMNSEVWINGHYLGKRPNGYISFEYELTKYINFGGDNVIDVKVDNSRQPNSRWYSGCGIYRNVRLVVVEPIHVVQWGTFVTTTAVGERSAVVDIETTIENMTGAQQILTVVSSILNTEGVEVASVSSESTIKDGESTISQSAVVVNPVLWDTKNPYLYVLNTDVILDGRLIDNYQTPFGIRTINFDPYKGFFLNGNPLKIRGVCNHHDLGALGSALNVRAKERQLEILKEMGCNGIRTSHNPPAPELLDLCDRMGFIVMDETFDMWKQKKVDYDFHLFWDEWHVQDLKDHIRRDRNHPSVCIWSVGNEIPEQWTKDGDTSGVAITRELVDIVKALDETRPVTTANNEPKPSNHLIRSGALDLIGFNYHHEDWVPFHKTYPGQKFIVTESTSALETRGYYQMPSDTTFLWPKRWDIPFSTDHNQCSSYDNVHAPWGSSHEEAVMLLENHDHISGMYIWTGFDYIGEPTPYGWPAKSSHFGIIDLAGFPKDIYYMYQSQWTSKPVLHLLPHWNWQEGQAIDVWAFSNADEVELFLNGKSLGVKTMKKGTLHFMWRLKYKPGTLKAIAKKDGKVMLEKTISTASAPATLRVVADRSTIKADGNDLSFVSVFVEDKDGNLAPLADNEVQFEISGPGFIAGVDNGSPISHEPHKASKRKAFYGKCLAIVQNSGEKGTIKLMAVSKGLESAEVAINVD